MSDEEKMTVFVTSGPDTPQRTREFKEYKVIFSVSGNCKRLHL